MNTSERIINLLPYYLQDGKKIKAWYNVLSFFYDELIDIFVELIDGQDIDNAEKFALDLLGDIVVKKRTQKYKDDEKYRNRLKTKIMQNNSMGHIEDINNIANAFLGENFEGIRQGYQFEELENEPAMLEIMLNSNKLESSTLEHLKQTLKVGTIQVGSNQLGCGMQSQPKFKLVKKYKPIFIPRLKSAVATGVRLQYKIKNEEDITRIKASRNLTLKSMLKKTKIKSTSNINFKNKTNKIIINNISKVKFKNKILNLSVKELKKECILTTKKRTIKTICTPLVFKQNFVKCGTTTVCAKMGVLL